MTGKKRNTDRLQSYSHGDGSGEAADGSGGAADGSGGAADGNGGAADDILHAYP